MQAWLNFLQQLEPKLGSSTVDKWLKSLKIAKFDACNLYLEAQDSFQIVWFNEHIKDFAKQLLKNNNNKPIKVHLLLKETHLKEESDQKPSSLLQTSTIFQAREDSVEPSKTFDNFIVFDGNELAFKLLKELSLKQLALFNPIYIHGRKGVGKTHLLQATYHHLQKLQLSAVYVKAETFTHNVVQAIRLGYMNDFRNAYRHFDVLIIDDIEVLANKNATQEEFFHTFNDLHLKNKQIIIASCHPPQELNLVEPRLISRFEWGVVAQIESIKGKDLKHFIATQATQLPISLSSKAQDFLSETFQKPHLIEQVLATLHSRILSLNEPLKETISSAKVEELLKDLIQEQLQEKITSERIIKLVSEYAGVPVDELLGKSQSQECTKPRQWAMYLCRQKLHLPYMELGSIFSRDHSTVMASVRHVEKMLQQKDSYACDAIYTINKQLI